MKGTEAKYLCKTEALFIQKFVPEQFMQNHHIQLLILSWSHPVELLFLTHSLAVIITFKSFY